MKYMSLHLSTIIVNCVWPSSDVLKKTCGDESLRTLRSRASEILKRSSTMRGGDYYKKKKLLATPQHRKSSSLQTLEVGSSECDSPPRKKSTPSASPRDISLAKDDSSDTDD
jgi:hypothetical protein